MKRALRITGTISGFLILVGVIIILLNSKSIELSREDRVYIRRFLNDWHINSTSTDIHKNFETELSFISRIQDSVLSNITGEQIPHVYFGNVRYYYQKRQGICYDRAVLIEKTLLLYNFKFRHVYIYFGDRTKPGVTDFLRKNITSHAALEVKTKKGWMAIGTDANWLGIRKNGELADYYEVRKELEKTSGNPLWQKTGTIGSSTWKIAGYHFRIIYGIYSRHGDFFTGASTINSTSLFTNKRHFLPDYNCRMLLYNL